MEPQSPATLTGGKETPRNTGPTCPTGGRDGKTRGQEQTQRIKGSTAPPGTPGSTTARPEHPSSDENDLQNNFMKTTEAL